MWITILYLDLETLRKELCTCKKNIYDPGKHLIGCPYVIPANNRINEQARYDRIMEMKTLEAA